MELKNYFYTCLLCATLLGVGACEKIGEDTPIEIPTNTDSDERVFYGFQNNDVLVDLSQLLRTTDVSSLRVLSDAQFGKISFLPQGVLSYEPNEEVSEANEQIVMEWKKANGAAVQELVVIKIVPEPKELPCVVMAMSDAVELNATMLIDVLKNDILCESTLNKLRIVENTKNGTAKITNDNKIEYTPKVGFRGIDNLIYGIEATQEGRLIRRIARLKFVVNDPNVAGANCVNKLRDDVVLYKPQEKKDSFLIQVFVNDMICPKSLSGGAPQVTIAQAPKRGSVKIINGLAIGYAPKNLIGSIAHSDTILYRVKLKNDSTIYQAKVIIMPAKNNTNCKLQANFDDIRFDKEKLKGKNSVEFNVLKNDVLCSNALKEIALRNPKKWNLTVKIDGTVTFTPKNGQFDGTVDFAYDVIDSQGVVSLAGVRIKFVD